LQEKKCDVMQGYHISRPVPPEEIQALLERIRSNPGKGPEIVMGN
jgi:EAL domain-containing protein (putative c-di-GMP-specific phosphodiesterase class I)